MEKYAKTIIKFSVILIVTIGLVTALSIPLGLYPKLGSFLLPGEGSIWSIPQEISKQETLKVVGLDDEVTVYRDQWGIPHIYGMSEKDIMFALGYVHAQDRLFQMDMARRATRGKLSEILGPSMLEADQFSLNKLMDYWAIQTYEQMKNSLDPVDIEMHSILISYTEGVNYYIENAKTLPLEFLFLSYKPDLWSPIDSLAFVKYMSEMLTWSYTDFTTLRIHDAIGKDAFNELFGSLPYQIPITSDYGSFLTKSDIGEVLENSVSDISSQISDLVSQFMEDIMTIPGEKEFIEQSHHVGSNNNAVNGSKTHSGKPILSNDMHLSFNLPGIWYEAHLVDQSPGSDFNVYGFYLAGVPYQIVGHNKYVGWGMTNTGIDVLDWYYYKGINDTHYWYNDTKTAYETTEYNIPVKGQDPENFIIKSTVHGPVFTNLFDTGVYSDYINDVIACKWIAHNVSYEFRTIYSWSHAKNKAEFDLASSYFTTPAQNVVYADVDGNIAIRPTGKVPIRDDSDIPVWHYGNGSMPYNGSAAQGEWTGYIPFEELPHTMNPDQGFVVSANQISAGPEYLANYSLQNPISVASGYRARRINELLANANDLTMEDMKQIQLDVYSTRAGNFTPLFIEVLAPISAKTPTEVAAFNLLDDWDYVMDKESAGATIFFVWAEVFREETFRDEIEDTGCPIMPYNAILEWLSFNNETSVWFDNITTPAVETRDEIIINSFRIAISALEEFFGTEEVTEWKWGELNKVEFPHITGLSSLGYGPVSISGSDHTPNVIWGKSVWKDGKVEESVGRGGASERLIIDFSDLNNTLSVIPSGQRAISFSNHYTDQLEMFLNGEYHVQYFAADSVEKFKKEWIESSILFKVGGS
jgi:penicillin amidase